MAVSQYQFGLRKIGLCYFLKYATCFHSSKEGNDSLLSKTRKCVSDIIRVCFFEAGRSIAHKCARFLALCIRSVLIISISLVFFISVLHVFRGFACILNWTFCLLLFDVEFIKRQHLIDALFRKYLFRVWVQRTPVFQLHLLEEISSLILTSLNVKVLWFFCSNGRCDPSQQGFGSVLLKALLDNMPLLPAAATGGTYAVFLSWAYTVHLSFVELCWTVLWN